MARNYERLALLKKAGQLVYGKPVTTNDFVGEIDRTNHRVRRIAGQYRRQYQNQKQGESNAQGSD